MTSMRDAAAASTTFKILSKHIFARLIHLSRAILFLLDTSELARLPTSTFRL